MIQLTLPLPPSANRYWKQANGRIYVSAEARRYKEDVGWICAALGVQPIEGAVSVSINVYRQQKRGDLDNFLKVLFDSLKGYCFSDDDQVLHISANRYDDKDNPRIEVMINAWVARTV